MLELLSALVSDIFHKRRYPFLGLALAAIAGISTAYYLPVTAIAYAAASVGFACGALLLRRTALCLAMTFCVMAAIFLWQTRESPAEQFAKQFGSERAVVTLEGTVVDEPEIRDERMRFVFQASRGSSKDSPFPHSISVLVFSKSFPVGVGDKLEITGSLQRILPVRNPGEFDARSHNWLQGIYFDFFVTDPMDVKVISIGKGEWLKRNFLHLRAWIMQTLGRGISDDVEVASVLQTIVLGTIAGTSDATEEAFRRTGTYHLFSVSGLHVAMIATILWYLSRIFRIRRNYAVIVIIPLL
ncbi:MAG: ComEC family competence protein, partial [Chthoniobacterales bacterium]